MNTTMNVDKNILFKKALNEEFAKRAKKNPQYSIRSFAQHLQVESSSLSQIMSGKRKLTDKMCERLGSRLGFGPIKMRTLTRSFSPARDSFENFAKLQEDTFKVISDWHYYSILELTYCDEFKGNARWISRVLGLSFATTIDAVERLKRLQYLEITPEGKWVDKLGDTNNLGNEFKTPAFTEHQRQILTKAVEALDKIPYSDRVQSSMTVAASKEKVVEAKQMILNFIEELNDFLRSGNARDEVYNISVSLFPTSITSQGNTYEN
ncbi:MAG: TIGR02147 family protein [Bacteriovoracaceae bacterium]